MAQLVPMSQKLTDMRQFLTKRAGELQAALPKTAQLDASRFIRVVLTNFQLTPKLLDCTKASIYVSMLQAAQFGLELDPLLGHAYLVPYKDKCQLMIGYKGYMVLARRSGLVTSINARVVHQKDGFDYEDGLERRLVHRPYMGADAPGDVIASYVIARFKDGDFSIDVMPTRDIAAIRKRSRAGDSGPWVTDWNAMAMKTVIRRAVKFWPSSVELQAAANLDEQLDTGQDQTFTLDPGDYSLLDEGEQAPAGENASAAAAQKSSLDKLAEVTATTEQAPAAPPPPPPPADDPGPELQKPPAEKPPAEKPAAQKTAAPKRAVEADEETQGRARSREEVQQRHEVPRHQRQQPALTEREPGEDG